ncbi:MAG: hypothetical protein IH862_04880, partial [Chloroflexi bacterium]|nr:hypothetical protein [Chloroflexota bacterium]
VAKGDKRSIYGDYIGVFNWDEFKSKIIPDLKKNNRLRGSEFPVLMISWRLRGRDPSKGPLAITRRSFPQPPRRKIPETEQWEAVIEVIDDSWRVTRVEGRRLVDVSFTVE